MDIDLSLDIEAQEIGHALSQLRRVRAEHVALVEEDDREIARLTARWNEIIASLAQRAAMSMGAASAVLASGHAPTSAPTTVTPTISAEPTRHASTAQRVRDFLAHSPGKRVPANAVVRALPDADPRTVRDALSRLAETKDSGISRASRGLYVFKQRGGTTPPPVESDGDHGSLTDQIRAILREHKEGVPTNAIVKAVRAARGADFDAKKITDRLAWMKRQGKVESGARAGGVVHYALVPDVIERAMRGEPE